MSAPERLTSNDANSVMTQVAEPKPGWWSSLLAQLTGRSLDRAVEVDDDVEEKDPDDTESPAPDTIDVADDVPTVTEPLEAELVEETPPPDDPESKPADSVELEVLDAELVDDEPSEVTVPEVDTAEVPEVEPADPEPEPVVVDVPELDTPEVDTTAAVVVEEPTVNEPAVVCEEPTPELDATELDASDPEPHDTVFTDPETPEVETVEAVTVEVEVEPAPGNSDRGPTGPVKDRDDLTERWLDELRSGKHRQTHGAWENYNEGGLFGGKSECTIQVAINTFDIPLGELRNKYGERFVGDVLYKNDVEMQSFKQIADFIERTQLSRSRQKELEMER